MNQFAQLLAPSRPAGREELSRAEADLAVEVEMCQRNLAFFVREAWPHFDPAPYQHSWHIDAICEHLEAITSGEIKQLLINIPPRHMKTGLLLLWQVWTWTLPQLPGQFNKMRGPGVQFLCAAYNATKAQSDGVKARNLIRTDWFQARWGEKVRISSYVDNREQFDTTKGGYRISVGIPESLGKGGIIRLLDDPHKTSEVEEGPTRETVIQNYDETWTTRSNDPEDGAEVLVMQRLDAMDLSGHVLDYGGWEHFFLPLEYEPDRHCVTSLGWQDPRGLDDDTGERLTGAALEERRGEPIWPHRFTKAWCREQERKVGPFAFAGQYQQRPAPRGGGIVQSELWRTWEKPVFPILNTVLVSFDGAYTVKTLNDPSAITVWGRFSLPDVREPQFMLLWAWEGRLVWHDMLEQLTRACIGDWRGDLSKKARDGGTKADVLLIEAKATGISVAQEMVNLHGRRKWRTILDNPRGDKVARLTSVQHMFAGTRRIDGERSLGQIWAPDKDWAQKVIDQVANFPKGGHDDLTDTVSQALKFLRSMGGAPTEEEATEEWVRENSYRKPRRARYPCG